MEQKIFKRVPVVSLERYKDIIASADRQELHIEVKSYLHGGIDENNEMYATALCERLVLSNSWLSVLLWEELKKWKEQQ